MYFKVELLDFSLEALLLSRDQNDSADRASDCISFVFLSILDQDPTHDNLNDLSAND